MPQRLERDACQFSPLRQWLCDPISLKKNCCAPVKNLRFPGGPPAILWRVRTVVVNAIQGCPGGREAHVGNEVFKNVPTTANKNTSTPVQRVSRRVGVFTTLAHAIPHIVDGGARQSMAMICRVFKSKTSARFSPVVDKVGAVDINDVPAVTAALPYCPATLATADMPHRNKALKALTNQIAKCHLRNSTTNSQERHQRCMEAQS